jgi:Flp pilus assembly protein TadD
MTAPTLRHLLGLHVLGLGLALAFGAHAADIETTPVENVRIDDFAAGKKAVEAKDWKLASDSFANVVAKDGKNADAYNYLGFSLRWQNRYDEAFAAYGKALALNPSHKGALHYSGIAYLKTGQKAQAEAQLARLKKVCATCDETNQLAKAVADAQVAAK